MEKEHALWLSASPNDPPTRFEFWESTPDTFNTGRWVLVVDFIIDENATPNSRWDNPADPSQWIRETNHEAIADRKERLKREVRFLLEEKVQQGVDGPRDDSYPSSLTVASNALRAKASATMTTLYSVPTLANGLQGLNNNQLDELVLAIETMLEVCNKRGQELYVDINGAGDHAALDAVEADLPTVLASLPADIHTPNPGGWPPPPVNR